MRPGHPFRAWRRRHGVAETTRPRQKRCRLNVTRLEDRVTPSNSPFVIARPTAFGFFDAVASDAQGNSVVVYSTMDTCNYTFNILGQRVKPARQHRRRPFP